MAATDTAAPPALNAHDFLNIDALLSDEERMIRDNVRAYVREHNIYRWAGTLIAELTSLRTREVPPRPKIAPIGEFKAGGRKLA